MQGGIRLVAEVRRTNFAPKGFESLGFTLGVNILVKYHACYTVRRNGHAYIATFCLLSQIVQSRNHYKHDKSGLDTIVFGWSSFSW